jgi:hypothetical protein
MNNPSLVHSMLAGMGQQPPQQIPPQPPAAGGLGQMGAKQSTEAALQQQNRDDYQLPGLDGAAAFGNQQFSRYLQQQLMQGLPSQSEMQRARTARGLLMQNVLEGLAPQEYSGMDNFAAGITSYQKPIMRGEEGAALAAMGSGAVQAKRQFQDMERKKAATAYGVVDSELDQQQKTITDAMGRMKSLTGNATPEFMLPDGTPVYKSGTRLVYIGKDGKPVEWLGAEKTVIGGDTLYGKRAQMVEMLTKEYLERGTYENLEEATLAAEKEANRLIGGISQQSGVQPRPTTPAAGTPNAQPQELTVDGLTGVDLNMLNSFSPENKASAMRVINRYQMNPNEGTKRAMEQELARILSSSGQQTPIVAGMPKKDARREAGKKEYGGEEGKALFKERDAFSQAYQANTALSSQLDVLDSLYSTPNLPEGKLGPAIQNMRSTLKSLGVDVGEEVGAADMANALAQKMVLGIRTADGVNLLPGAISNFEVQMLQSMGPTLGMSAEGRKALVAYMKAVAASQLRLSEEATKFASANDDRLTPEWYKRKERIILEEQARRAQLLRGITSQLKGKQ